MEEWNWPWGLNPDFGSNLLLHPLFPTHPVMLKAREPVSCPLDEANKAEEKNIALTENIVQIPPDWNNLSGLEWCSWLSSCKVTPVFPWENVLIGAANCTKYQITNFKNWSSKCLKCSTGVHPWRIFDCVLHSIVQCVLFFLWQVRNNFRTAVTIPERSWARFRDVLSEFVDKSSIKDSE